jgi:hypothetical protein
MIEYNEGVRKENEAKQHLEAVYDYVRQTGQRDFYDYLVRKGTTDIFIEVKWVECRYKTAGIYINWKQFWKLIAAKDFMFYILTSKGNFFISPEQVFDYAHVHFNKNNPHEKCILLTAMFTDGKFALVAPTRCLNCNGTLTDYMRA